MNTNHSRRYMVVAMYLVLALYFFIVFCVTLDATYVIAMLVVCMLALVNFLALRCKKKDIHKKM